MHDDNPFNEPDAFPSAGQTDEGADGKHPPEHCPRRLLVCSGPPVDRRDDPILAKIVGSFPGRKVICGGTTSKIMARELGRPLRVDLGNVGSGLPPASKMEGVDLVTEGVLTLGRVKCLLETGEESACEGGPAAALVRTMTRSDTIEFVVGTCINPLHRDPTLPVELQLRRNLINDIANILKNTYGKEVSIKYM